MSSILLVEYPDGKQEFIDNKRLNHLIDNKIVHQVIDRKNI